MAKAVIWCRLYSEILEDPKIQMLPGDEAKFWINCLAMATRNGGFLPDDDVIAWTLRVSRNTVETFRNKLVERGLLEYDHKERLKMHNWEDRQYVSDSSTERVHKFREKRLKQRGNVDETFQKRDTQRFPSVSVSVSDSVNTNPEVKTKTKKSVPFSENFQKFWDRWIVITGRGQRPTWALQAFLSVVDIDNEMACLACLERYGASDEVKRGIVSNPDKWLFEQAEGAFKGTWQEVKNLASNGIAGTVERYFNEHPD